MNLLPHTEINACLVFNFKDWIYQKEKGRYVELDIISSLVWLLPSVYIYSSKFEILIYCNFIYKTTSSPPPTPFKLSALFVVSFSCVFTLRVSCLPQWGNWILKRIWYFMTGDGMYNKTCINVRSLTKFAWLPLIIKSKL